jgi:hypothetical protein
MRINPYLLVCSIVMILGVCGFFNVQAGYTIKLSSSWSNIESPRTQKEVFGGQWILAGTITFTKNARDAIMLNRLCLRWQGPPLNFLTASLYRKKNDQAFLPIEENVVSDGQWSRQDQTLLFKFNTGEKLSAVSTFYLVLTVPHSIEPLLRKGYFTIEPTCLPDPFQQYAYNNIKLSFCELN